MSRSSSIHILITLRLLQCLSYVNSEAVNIAVHVSFRIKVFSKYMPRNGIAGSYGNSIFRNNFYFKEPPCCSP